jgi:enoyl-CoA hydratase
VQNEAFIADLNATFDCLQTDHPECAVVLTGQPGSFCGGLDFETSWALLGSGDTVRIDAFFVAYRNMNLRLWTYPRPTVAAINSHAFAGGLLLALACDYRVCSRDARLALNEVPIGIAMPAAYVEVIRYAVGSASASLLTLFGREIDAVEAARLGAAHAVAATDQVMNEARTIARSIHPDAMEGFAFTKRALQLPAVERIASVASVLDRELIPLLASPDARRARARRYAEIRGKAPPWG